MTSTFLVSGKVIYTKYSNHWPNSVAHTIDCVCSKMLNHGLNHGLFLSLFKFFGWKYIQIEWIQNKRKIYCYTVSDLRFLLKIQAILPETSPFLFAQMAVLSSSFQMFIVLGMYNFAFLLPYLTLFCENSAHMCN